MIQDIYRTNLYNFQYKDLDYDYFVFATEKRNTRTIIEAFLDLYNLKHDKNYIEIINYNCRINGANNEKLELLLDKYKVGKRFKRIKPNIDIKDKIKIAKSFKKNEETLNEILEQVKIYNRYIHPNIANNPQNRIEDILKLLRMNILIYDIAYRLIHYSVFGESEIYDLEKCRQFANNLLCNIENEVILFTFVDNQWIITAN
jgi:hypothetical protein